VCGSCDFRFTTYERVDLGLPFIVKKDGRREAYSRDKLKIGIVRACEKRPVSAGQIEASTDSIERRLNELGVKELPSRSLGELVMEALKKLDLVAYVRFASVYREFSDIEQFSEAVRGLDAP
jgi:transcriptional repressor NrdR